MYSYASGSILSTNQSCCQDTPTHSFLAVSLPLAVSTNHKMDSSSARFGSTFPQTPFQFSLGAGAASSSKESSTTPEGHRNGPTVEDKKRKILVRRALA